MANIDYSELAKKSKSEHGQYQSEKESNFLKVFYELFLKVTFFKTFVNGLITAGTFIYWIYTKNNIPLFIWFFYLFFINVSGYLYWKNEERRIDREMKKLERELSDIKKEIFERQKYFMDLKEKIDKGEYNN